LVLLTIAYYKRQKNQALKLLEIERDRSESLLLNILPQKIADMLKAEEGTIAEHYDSASILFADMVGFTPMSVHLTPTEMIELLNEIYSHFDTLAEKYAVEKIRTIGDNYMVASGVPEPRPDHAEALANMALDILAYAKDLPAQNGESINFRIGINSGPLVAGVIGQKKFQYDVWGDTVNTASRMESHGVAGKVHITARTRELIQDGFLCEKRGIMTIKGKGEMETWLLVGRK
jgi:class 3 adenylate cyclase